MTTLWPEQRLQEVEARLKETSPLAVASDLADAVAEIRRLQKKLGGLLPLLEDLQRAKHIRGYGDVCPECDCGITDGPHGAGCRLDAAIQACRSARAPSPPATDSPGTG